MAYRIDATSDQIFQEFAAQGQSFFNASGDSDAYTGLIPSPADDPNITVVGGTTLTTTGPGGAWVSETVWNWGGRRRQQRRHQHRIPDPVWQQGISMTTNQGSTTMRNMPDVALTADNVYVIYGDGRRALLAAPVARRRCGRLSRRWSTNWPLTNGEPAWDLSIRPFMPSARGRMP